MENNLYSEYEIKIELICSRYVGMYKNEFPEERTFDTAKEFMDREYEKYRKEVARVGIDIMHASGLNSDLSKKIINQNAWSIGKLFTDVMNLSL